MDLINPVGLGFHLKGVVWMFIIFSGSALLCLQLELVAELCTLGLDTLQRGDKLEGDISAGSLPPELDKPQTGDCFQQHPYSSADTNPPKPLYPVPHMPPPLNSTLKMFQVSCLAAHKAQ